MTTAIGELMQSLDEVADSFAATVTGNDQRLLRLAEEARMSAFAGREIATCYEMFAQGVERRSLPLCRAAASHLRGGPLRAGPQRPPRGELVLAAER